MKIKIKIVIGIFLLINFNINAQEISIKLNAGPSGILYESSGGNGLLKIGGGLGIGYTYFLSNHWDIATGLDFMYNQNSYQLNDGTIINSYEVDDQTSAFEYRVTPKNYNEEQHFVSLAVPIFLHYSSMLSRQTKWYLGLGGKILFPGKQTIKASADQMQISGYYPDLNILIDDLPSHGFGKVYSWKGETSVNLEPTVLISIETGLIFTLKENMKLYTGIYADYGLTDLAKSNSNSNIVTYSPDGISNLQAKGLIENQKIVDNARYFSAGIELKLGFSLTKQKTAATKIVPVQSITEVNNSEQRAEVVTEKIVKTTLA
jgi:Outer membrane protein beta-barrel domain